MARPGTRPTPNKADYEIRSEVPANQKVPAAEQNYMISKANESGLNDAWSSVVKFDDEYYPYEYKMSGAITYTIDATGAGTGNGRKDTIVGDGNTITFTGFTIRESDLSHSSNVVTTAANHIYTVVFLRVGSVSEVYLRDTEEVITPPTVTSATVQNADPDALVVVFSEAVTITDMTGLSLDGSWAGTSITGVSGSGTNTLTFALDTEVANGESGNFVYGATNNIEDLSGNGLAASSTVVTNNVVSYSIVGSSDFSVDLNDLVAVNPDSPYPSYSVNAGALDISTTSGEPNSGFFANYISGPSQITNGTVAAKYVSSSDILFVQPAMSIWADVTNRVTLAPANTGKQRAFVVVGGVTEYQFDPGTIDVFNNRWKIVINGNDISFWYYNAGWVQFGTTQVFDIGTNKNAGITFSNDTSRTETNIVDDLYITDGDYLTEIPV